MFLFLKTVYRQCLEKIQNDSEDRNISNVEYSKCEEPLSNLPEKTFQNLWRTVYWSTQFLTW